MSQSTNQYSVTLSNGETHTVNTPNHHDDHHEKDFNDHLIDILKATIANVAAYRIERVVFRGRKH